MEDTRFQEAVELFNSEEFFACHDVLEELWSEAVPAERDFLQGLIHAAVALFHFSEGNLGGARKMYSSTLRYLAGAGAVCREIDLERFRQDFQVCFQELLNHQSGYPEGIQLDPALLPRWHRAADAEPGQLSEV